MKFIREYLIFMAGLSLPFLIGPVVPVGGFIALAVFFGYFVPRFWHAAKVRHYEREDRRKRANIQTQMLQGKLDAQLIREVGEDMKRNGML